MGIYQTMTGAFKNFFNSGESEAVKTRSMSEIMELFNGSYNAEMGADLSEITYFTCLKTLSEALGKPPLYLMTKDKERVLDHDTIYSLTVEPNDRMIPAQLFTALEFCRNHFGNGYAYIHRNPNGTLNSLHLLDPLCVQVWINNTNTFLHRPYFYRYTDSQGGELFWINPADMLHFKSWIVESNGIVGKSVREILASSFLGSKAGAKFLNDLYQKGLTANAVIKYVGDLNKKEQNELLKRAEEQAKERGRMITLPIGFDIQTLDLKLSDSQFYELRKYSALQIAAAFGVKPDHLNDYSKSSYSNSVMQSLSFYINTLLYNITLYEQELNRKLLTRQEIEAGMGYKFNVSVMLRGDPSQQADILQKMVQSGIYSINDALHYLDRPSCENGDVHMINGSYVKLEDIGIAYQKRGVTS